MHRAGIRIASDYNRGLIAPVRWAHVCAACVRPLGAWVTHESRRNWAPAVVLTSLGVACLAIDGCTADRFRGARLGGDLRREMEAVQQYGQLTCSLLIGLVIWLGDEKRRARLGEWIIAAILTGLACNALKMGLGRPRPKHDDAWHFLLPSGMYPLGGEGAGGGVGEAPVLRHSWEFWASRTSELWSMPSSHTAYAVVASVFLGTVYPRIGPVVWALAAVVGIARVVLAAHYPSDVFIGAALGCAIAARVVKRKNSGQWGMGNGE